MKPDEQQLNKKASMKKNFNVLNQMELNNDINLIRSESGIFRDTSNEYHRTGVGILP